MKTLSHILFSSLLFFGACTPDEGQSSQDKSDALVDFTTDGIGKKIITVNLLDQDIYGIDSATVDRYPELANLKFHASNIDDEDDPSNILVFMDKKNGFKVGGDVLNRLIYTFANHQEESGKLDDFNIILDMDVHPNQKVAFWSQEKKFFIEITAADEKVVQENSLSLTIYEAEQTEELVLDAFMQVDDRVDFEVAGKWYSFTLTNTDIFTVGSLTVEDSAEFLLEEAARKCVWSNCTNLNTILYTAGKDSPTFTVEGQSIWVEVLTEITLQGESRVQLSFTDFVDTCEGGFSCNTSGKCIELTDLCDSEGIQNCPDNSDESELLCGEDDVPPPVVGVEGGRCKENDLFPGLVGVCQNRSEHPSCATGAYVTGLCNGAGIICCEVYQD